MERRATLVLGLALGLAGAVGAADIHQWRDADGRVHFGDHPPAGAASTVVKVRPNVYQSPSVEGLAKVFARAPDKVVMYSASWCGYCRKARRYFEAHQVPFEEYDVETSEKGQRDYAALGARGVPVILVGDKRLNGFTEAAFTNLYGPR